MNSKSIAGVLMAGTLVLGGASAYAAMLPSPLSAASTAQEVPGIRPNTMSVPAGGGQTSLPFTTGASSAVFTVQTGDTIPIIARWFIRHGYRAAWSSSSSEFTSEAHLVFPGERLVIANGAVTVIPPLDAGDSQ